MTILSRQRRDSARALQCLRLSALAGTQSKSLFQSESECQSTRLYNAVITFVGDQCIIVASRTRVTRRPAKCVVPLARDLLHNVMLSSL